MTLGVKWVYSQNDTYKSAETVVHSLVDIVATGGSLLLDVGPVSDYTNMPLLAAVAIAAIQLRAPQLHHCISCCCLWLPGGS